MDNLRGTVLACTTAPSSVGADVPSPAEPIAERTTIPTPRMAVFGLTVVSLICQSNFKPGAIHFLTLDEVLARKYSSNVPGEDWGNLVRLPFLTPEANVPP